MPFAAAPRLDDLGGHHVHENLGEAPAFRIALEVVGGVLLEVRVPGDLLGEHDLAVDEGGGLAVAAAEVEADAAALEVAALSGSQTALAISSAKFDLDASAEGNVVKAQVSTPLSAASPGALTRSSLTASKRPCSGTRCCSGT